MKDVLPRNLHDDIDCVGIDDYALRLGRLEKRHVLRVHRKR